MDKIPRKEYWNYSLSTFGQNLIFSLVASYLLIFYTDAARLAPAAVGVMMLIGRIFDAANDPFMGSIVDRTRTRWGKLRPYMLLSPIPIGIVTVLCFWMPESLNDNTSKMIYAYITYFSFGIIYTVQDVPFWGLSSAMSKDSNERTKLLTMARLFGTAGAGLCGLLVPLITGYFTGGIYESWGAINAPLLQEAAATLSGDALIARIAEIEAPMAAAVSAKLRSVYLYVAIGITTFAVPLLMLSFFTKERCRIDPEIPSLKENLKLVIKNKPLVTISLANILGSFRGIYGVFGLYLCKYNLANYEFMGMKGESLFVIMGLAMTPLGLLGTVLTPWAAKKLGKKWLCIFMNIMQFFIVVLIYVFGVNMMSTGAFQNSTMLLLIILYGVLGFPSTIYGITNYAMVADSIDYLELKTGKRAEGVCFSLQTFVNQICTAANTFAVTLTIAILQAVNKNYYIPNQLTQPEVTLRAFFTVTFIGSAISSILAILPLFFYRFTEKEQRAAIATIRARHTSGKAECVQSVVKNDGLIKF